MTLIKLILCMYMSIYQVGFREHSAEEIVSMYIIDEKDSTNRVD